MIYPIFIEFHGDDTEHLDIEADTYRQACWAAYTYWSRTGWTDLTVYTPSRRHSRYFDLDQPYRPLPRENTWMKQPTTPKPSRGPTPPLVIIDEVQNAGFEAAGDWLARRLLQERINELRETADNPIYLGIIRRWATARANVLEEKLADLLEQNEPSSPQQETTK